MNPQNRIFFSTGEFARLPVSQGLEDSLANRDLKERIEYLNLCMNILLESSPNYKDNIFRLLSRDACHYRHNILEPQTLEMGCPLDNGRHRGLESPNSLGLFSRMPPELLTDILVERLDLSSLTKLRSVSRGVRSMVSSLPQYNAIVTHAPASLRATLSLQTAKYTSCRQLYKALCSEFCTTCPEFGAYLYVPTCERVCYLCFTTKLRYKVITSGEARARWGMNAEVSKDTIHFLSLPGKYQIHHGSSRRRRLCLVDPRSVAEAADAFYGSYEKVAEEVVTARQNRMQKRAERMAAWQNAPEHSRAQRHPRIPSHVSRPTDYMQWDPYRRMGIVGFPWLNPRTATADWGVACDACWECKSDQDFEENYQRRCVLYPKAGFIEHVFLCEAAMARLLKDGARLRGPLIRSSGRICDIAGDQTIKEQEPQNQVYRSGGDCCFNWYGKPK